MRKGLADGITIALIGLLSALITVVFEKETNNSITKIIYQEENNTCEEKEYPKIIFTDDIVYNK